jgi:pheromone shutdown protein TraB
MADTAKKKTKALVIGTRHEYQRRQDTSPEREQVRAAFEERLRKIIAEGDVSLIAEEAGDDRAVWEPMKREDEACGEFAELFGCGRIVNSPVPTIAKTIADDQTEKLRHVDIRAPNAAGMSIKQRDEAMATKVMEVLGEADSVVVIVGEVHRAGVEKLLRDQELSVESMRFPAQ